MKHKFQHQSWIWGVDSPQVDDDGGRGVNSLFEEVTFKAVLQGVVGREESDFYLLTFMGTIRWFVHWPLMGGLLHLVSRGGAWRGGGCGPAQSPHRCTKCNSPPISGQCINFISFIVVLLLHLHSIGLNQSLKQEVKVIWQKAPNGGGVTPGGRKLYHWIPGVGFPISVP